jgi:antirestriction protein
MKTILSFDCSKSARLIAEQLYGVEEQDGNVLILKNLDKAAMLTAVKLAGVEYPRIKTEEIEVSRDRCHLPFPRREREYTGDCPTAYVVCLAAYNNGISHGMQINCCEPLEKIKENISWLLSWSPVRDITSCEEWAIHDYSNFYDYSVDEYEDLDNLNQIAIAVESGEAMAIWLETAKYAFDKTTKELAEMFSDYYIGHYDSEKDFAQSDYILEQKKWDDFEDKFEFWSYSIDWDSVARNLLISEYDSYRSSDIGVYVFRQVGC